MRKLALMAAAAATFALPAAAQDPFVNSKPDGTIVLDAKAAAAGIGYTWGNGTLYFHGHEYPFSVKGITVADVGFAEITGHGRVYHLTSLNQFSGTYAALTGEATAGRGIGGDLLRNGNGVMIRVDEVTRGARLTGSGDGIRLTLVR